MQPRLRLLIAVLWVGSLWSTGYVVAPTLFATVGDRALAGTIAGSLFRVEAWLCLGCAAALLLLCMTPEARALPTRRAVVKLIVGITACTLVGHFGLQPFMAEIRAVAVPVDSMSSSLKLHFRLLHGAASILYLIQSLLGVPLVLQLQRESGNTGPGPGVT